MTTSGDGDSEPPQRDDLRKRLSNLPEIDEQPFEADWLRNDRPKAAPRPRTPSTSAKPPRVASPASAAPRAPVAVPTLPHEPLETRAPIDPEQPDEESQPRRWPRYLALGGLAIAVLGLLLLVWVWRSFSSIERVNLDGVLATDAAVTNYLLVGTDSRDGISAETENASVILGDGTSGQRSDTIIVLRTGPDGTRMLSLPRDLWLPIDGGSEQRINTALGRGGPEAVVNTVQSALGVPISGYLQVDLAGFVELVDAVGGVTVTIEHPAFDTASGLDLRDQSGEVQLDSAQALAFVRSRRYTEVIDGREVQDPTSDLGRVARQQEFLRALFSELTAERNPWALNKAVGAMSDSVLLDNQTGFFDMLSLARKLSGELPESVVLPTVGDRVGGASVLRLGSGHEEALDQFR